jgi:hypothetical protein
MLTTLLCVHACSEIRAPQSNVLETFTVGLESSVDAVKAMYSTHKVVAIVGHGKRTSLVLDCTA